MGKTPFLILAVMAAMSWGAAPAGANPFAHPHWDTCDSITINKLFTGPGIYRQVISGSGFDSPVRGHEVRLRVTPSNVYNYPNIPLPDAWRFDPAGCQVGRLSATAVGTGQPCPALASGAITTTIDFLFDGLDLVIVLRALYDLTTPAPQVTYVLGQLDFDHTGSAPGPQDPTQACGMAERQVCFVIRDGTWFDEQLEPHPIGFAQFFGISWQESGGAGCFGDLPVEPATWGGIRATYR